MLMRNEQMVTRQYFQKLTTYDRRKMLTLLAFLITHFSLLIPVSAQTFTQRLQQSLRGEGTVVVSHDKAIDLLVNGSVVNVVPAKQPVVKPDDTHNPNGSNTPSASANLAGSKTPAETTPRQHQQQEDTVAVSHQRSGRSYKAMGYRVQVFAGGSSRRDRQRAEQTGQQLQALFPNENVYTHFYSPRWLCRIGNYRTFEEAHQMQQDLKRLGFENATIVKGKIIVYY